MPSPKPTAPAPVWSGQRDCISSRSASVDAALSSPKPAQPARHRLGKRRVSSRCDEPCVYRNRRPKPDTGLVSTPGLRTMPRADMLTKTGDTQTPELAWSRHERTHALTETNNRLFAILQKGGGRLVRPPSQTRRSTRPAYCLAAPSDVSSAASPSSSPPSSSAPPSVAPSSLATGSPVTSATVGPLVSETSGSSTSGS